MAMFALIRPDNTIVRREANVDPGVKTKPGFKWLPVETTMPPFDTATQVREGPVYTVEPSRVTEVYSVRAKTAQELDADKEDMIPPNVSAVFKILFNHENRIRTLESRPQVTAAQFRAAVKALL